VKLPDSLFAPEKDPKDIMLPKSGGVGNPATTPMNLPAPGAPSDPSTKPMNLPEGGFTGDPSIAGMEQPEALVQGDPSVDGAALPNPGAGADEWDAERLSMQQVSDKADEFANPESLDAVSVSPPDESNGNLSQEELSFLVQYGDSRVRDFVLNETAFAQKADEFANPESLDAVSVSPPGIGAGADEWDAERLSMQQVSDLATELKDPDYQPQVGLVTSQMVQNYIKNLRGSVSLPLVLGVGAIPSQWKDPVNISVASQGAFGLPEMNKADKSMLPVASLSEKALNLLGTINEKIPTQLTQSLYGAVAMTNLAGSIFGFNLFSPELKLARPNDNHKLYDNSGREENKSFNKDILSVGVGTQIARAVAGFISNPVGAAIDTIGSLLRKTPGAVEFWQDADDLWINARSSMGMETQLNRWSPSLPEAKPLKSVSITPLNEDGTEDNNTAPILFELLTEQEDEHVYSVSSHPVYNNTMVSDHIMKENPTGSFTGLLLPEGEVDAHSKYSELVAIADRRSLVSIETHHSNIYQTCVLVKVARKSDHTDGNAVYAEVSYEEINSVALERVVINVQIAADKKILAKQVKPVHNNAMEITTAGGHTQSTTTNMKPLGGMAP
jgi:hypothetical protein